MSDSTSTNAHIATAVQTLDACRREAAAADAQIAKRRAAFDEQHAVALAEQQRLKERLQRADATLRSLLVAHYEATRKASPDGKTGDKQPLPGIGVKVGTGYEFDAAVAFAFAQERKMCLLPEQLDEKGFRDLCKVDSIRPAFVKIVETPVAQIASDLTKTLEAIATAPVVPAPTEEAQEEAEAPAVAAGDVG